MQRWLYWGRGRCCCCCWCGRVRRCSATVYDDGEALGQALWSTTSGASYVPYGLAVGEWGGCVGI